MTFLGRLRRRHNLIRSVFAVFVLAWLQTALLPCAMALSQGRPVETAAATEQATNAHQQQMAEMAAMMEEMPDCIYCPPDTQPVDADAATDCLYPSESRIEGSRVQQLHVDQLIAHPVFVSSPLFSLLPEPDGRAPPPRHLVAHPVQRPITLKYCVQLK